MRKGLVFLFAALLVVVLPLSSHVAGTRFTLSRRPVDYLQGSYFVGIRCPGPASLNSVQDDVGITWVPVIRRFA
jgi:hypothetical protein